MIFRLLDAMYNPFVRARHQTDMEDKRIVSRARAEQFATEVGGLLCETSAKENWGVNELFSKVRVFSLQVRPGCLAAYRRPACFVLLVSKSLPLERSRLRLSRSKPRQ